MRKDERFKRPQDTLLGGPKASSVGTWDRRLRFVAKGLLSTFISKPPLENGGRGLSLGFAGSHAKQQQPPTEDLQVRKHSCNFRTTRLPQPTTDHSSDLAIMSATAGRMASKVGQAATRAAGKAADAGASDKPAGVLQKGARKDPELYILLAVMSGAFGLAGFYFARKPTSSSSEAPVSMAAGTMPWQVESSKGQNADQHFKYQYHPGGDQNKAPKDAPSALHSVIVPNVNLPKSLHDQYNKWGKDGY